MSDPESPVLFEQRGALGLITLNRPKALNALTHAMCLAMKAQLDKWAADDTVKCVLIRGTGEKAFCAGGDIRSLYESGINKTPYALSFYRDEYILNAAIKHFPKPYIAFLHGIVMGGGVGVSVHGSHRVANETVTFAMPETGIGLFPDVGGSYFLPRCPGALGMYLALTGARLETADALYSGIITHFVHAQDTLALLELLEQGIDPDEALATMSRPPKAPTLVTYRRAIDQAFSENSVEEIIATLKAQSDEWSQGTAKTLRTKSPTSLKVTFREIRKGRLLEFDDCIKMEYRMVNSIIAGHDFYEGVRAVIIEKDNVPRWKPDTLAGVTDADVAAYFAPVSIELDITG